MNIAKHIEDMQVQLNDKDMLIITLTGEIKELKKELERLKCNTSE